MNRTPHLMRQHARRDYAQTPLNVYWEMTTACPLACRHCRAEAQAHADPRQLTTAEGRELIRQIAAFGDPAPQLILTGGDPMQRPDLEELIAEAHSHGISVSITPAASERLTRDMIVHLHDIGINALGLSLDGATAELHDAIRMIPGCFERTVNAARWANELGMPVQINTLLAAETVGHVPAIYDLLCDIGISRWSLFFLISVGRGKVLEALEPAQGEELMRWVDRTSRTAPFAMSTTEAPSFRRVAIQAMQEEGFTPEQIRRSHAYRSLRVRDGHGIMFVSHTGEICPAGFLPLPAGNVRTDTLADVYRRSPLFLDLHDPNKLKGKCGLCEYRAICGGSRSRAFSLTGDPLVADPFCPYQPAAHPEELVNV